MDTTEKKIFKSAMFGGFKRKEVFEYIENMVNIHNAELTNMKDEIKASTEENIRLRQQVEELRMKLDEAHSAAEEMTAKIERFKANEVEMYKQITVYAGMEEEYNSNKGRLAELELSAIARASEIEQEAQKKAQMLDEQAQNKFNQNQQRIAEIKKDAQVEMNKIVSDVKLSYNRLISEINGFNFKFDDLVNNTKTNMQMLEKNTKTISDNFAAFEQKCSRICADEEQE